MTRCVEFDLRNECASVVLRQSPSHPQPAFGSGTMDSGPPSSMSRSMSVQGLLTLDSDQHLPRLRMAATSMGSSTMDGESSNGGYGYGSYSGGAFY